MNIDEIIVRHSTLTNGTAGLLISLITCSETAVPIRIGSISLYFPDCMFGEDRSRLTVGCETRSCWKIHDCNALHKNRKSMKLLCNKRSRQPVFTGQSAHITFMWCCCWWEWMFYLRNESVIFPTLETLRFLCLNEWNISLVAICAVI